MTRFCPLYGAFSVFRCVRAYRESRLLRTHVRSKTPKFSFIGVLLAKWQVDSLPKSEGQNDPLKTGRAVHTEQLARSRSAAGCGSPAATSKGHRPFEAPTEPTGETSSLRGSRAAALPSDMMLCVISYWVLSGAKWKKPSQLMAILLVL